MTRGDEDAATAIATAPVKDLIIRRASRHDVPAVIDLYAEDELSTSPRPADLEPVLAAFYAMAADPAVTIYVAVAGKGAASGAVCGAKVPAEPISGQRVVGTFQLNVLRFLTHSGAKVAQIEAVVVARAARGAGIGSALMRYAVSEARRLGCIRVQLTSQKRRTRAHAFYERLGFERSHEGMKLKL